MRDLPLPADGADDRALAPDGVVPISLTADQRTVLERAAALADVSMQCYLERSALDRARRDLAAASGEAPSRDGHLTGALSWRWILDGPERARYPSEARRLVRAALRARAPALRDDASAVLVSELVGNAVQHGGPGPVTLQMALDGVDLVCGVGDRGTAPPIPVRPGLGDENGRGLLLLLGLSDACGWYPTPAGKTVWFSRRLLRDGFPAGERAGSLLPRWSHPFLHGGNDAWSPTREP
ncbi:ATP-binding protein [Actinomadura parmotrematis]|uniref:ATP-binding protein n=1 Tax=Actinomadura parmotrematis TaxID=2864039 RepID=A0ABS7FKD3_9ACTN|nr:ATP-binding protein [Actinomadura parmotrematis]MBW8480816.1 ATP-binding protein [Actinomadura parmotrematis]